MMKIPSAVEKALAATRRSISFEAGASVKIYMDGKYVGVTPHGTSFGDKRAELNVIAQIRRMDRELPPVPAKEKHHGESVPKGKLPKKQPRVEGEPYPPLPVPLSPLESAALLHSIPRLSTIYHEVVAFRPMFDGREDHPWDVREKSTGEVRRLSEDEVRELMKFVTEDMVRRSTKIGEPTRPLKGKKLSLFKKKEEPKPQEPPPEPPPEPIKSFDQLKGKVRVHRDWSASHPNVPRAVATRAIPKPRPKAPEVIAEPPPSEPVKVPEEPPAIEPPGFLTGWFGR